MYSKSILRLTIEAHKTLVEAAHLASAAMNENAVNYFVPLLQQGAVKLDCACAAPLSPHAMERILAAAQQCSTLTSLSLVQSVVDESVIAALVQCVKLPSLQQLRVSFGYDTKQTELKKTLKEACGERVLLL